MNACCIGWSTGGFWSPFCLAYQAGSPSSVVIDLPSRDPSDVTHERVSTPSTRTEQEPHCASPQPNRGPCRSNSFERTYSRGVSGLEATGHKRSFTLILSPAAIWDSSPLCPFCCIESYTRRNLRSNPLRQFLTSETAGCGIIVEQLTFLDVTGKSIWKERLP